MFSTCFSNLIRYIFSFHSCYNFTFSSISSIYFYIFQMFKQNVPFEIFLRFLVSVLTNIPFFLKVSINFSLILNWRVDLETQNLKTLARLDIARSNKRCRNCLSVIHQTVDCKSKINCRKCGARHHSYSNIIIIGLRQHSIQLLVNSLQLTPPAWLSQPVLTLLFILRPKWSC